MGEAIPFKRSIQLSLSTTATHPFSVSLCRRAWSIRAIQFCMLHAVSARNVCNSGERESDDRDIRATPPVSVLLRACGLSCAAGCRAFRRALVSFGFASVGRSSAPRVPSRRVVVSSVVAFMRAVPVRRRQSTVFRVSRRIDSTHIAEHVRCRFALRRSAVVSVVCVCVFVDVRHAKNFIFCDSGVSVCVLVCAREYVRVFSPVSLSRRSRCRFQCGLCT